MCAAESCTRMRAFPRGTTGKENAVTYTPRSCISSAIRAASAASPNITGTMGCSPGSSSNPASVISSRNRAAFPARRERSASDCSSRSSAARVPATIGGASVLENR